MKYDFEITNSRYHKLLARKRRASLNGDCPICKPHKGCNRKYIKRKSWKHYRKAQRKVS
jgi:hypothetical protein